MLWIPPYGPIQMRRALAVCGVLALSGCASKYAQVPPRLDLEPYGRVALVAFSTEQTDDDLSTLATQRFAEALLASQRGVELLELGASDSSLTANPTGDVALLAQALGRTKEVPAVFVGHLKVSGVKPRARIGGAGNLNVRASVSAELTVRLVSTATGATVWRSSSAANGTVGHLAISGRPSIAMRDPNEAYGEVVNQLVAGVTRDLRPTWVKQ
jgi:hypothetical protein